MQYIFDFTYETAKAAQADLDSGDQFTLVELVSPDAGILPKEVKLLLTAPEEAVNNYKALAPYLGDPVGELPSGYVRTPVRSYVQLEDRKRYIDFNIDTYGQETPLSLIGGESVKLDAAPITIVAEHNGSLMFDEFTSRFLANSTGEMYMLEINFTATTETSNTEVSAWIDGINNNGITLFSKQPDSRLLTRQGGLENKVSINRMFYVESNDLIRSSVEDVSGFEIWIQANKAVSCYDFSITCTRVN